MCVCVCVYVVMRTFNLEIGNSCRTIAPILIYEYAHIMRCYLSLFILSFFDSFGHFFSISSFIISKRVLCALCFIVLSFEINIFFCLLMLLSAISMICNYMKNYYAHVQTLKKKIVFFFFVRSTNFIFFFSTTLVCT